MKTTGGKTRAPAQGTRNVHIYREGDHKLLSCKEASSLREALKMYFEDTLRGYGYTQPKHVGNTLTVIGKMNQPIVYVALETYQAHVLA
jgi:hypothetical protein